MFLPKPIRRTSLPGLALALAACGPLVQVGGNSAPPPALFTLRAEERPAPVRAASSAVLMIAQPTVPGALQTLRIPVIKHDTEIAYLIDATWVEQPSRLFQRLLSDVVGARGVTALDPRNAGPAPTLKLTGELLEFGLDVRDPAKPRVRVRFDATLTDRDGRLIGARRFEVVQPTPSQLPPAVAIALNSAANTAADQIAGWIADR